MTQISWLNGRGETISGKAKLLLTGKRTPMWLGLACLIVSLTVASSVRAASIFMSIGGQPAAINANPQNAPQLTGSSTDTQYPKWIELNSAQLGVGRAVGLSGGTISTSTPSFSEVVITKLQDNSTPSLYTLVCGGTASVTQPIDYVTIDFRKSGTTEAYYRLQLQGVYITGVSSSSGGDVPSESLTLFYSKITWTYVPFDQNGKAGPPVTKGWDVVKNVAL